jgi:hypothetical protein
MVTRQSSPKVEMSAQALRMAVINTAATDENFRDALIANPVETINERFGKQSLNISVHFEHENEVSILIPTKTDRLTRSLEQVVEEVGDRTPTRGEFEAGVVLKAWKDPAFKAQLESDPRKTIAYELRKYSANLPSVFTVRYYEEKPGDCVIVVSYALRELTKSAGVVPAVLVATATGTAAGVAGAIASKVVDKIWPVQGDI